MIILGLGTNVGDRLENLRVALAHLKQLPKLKIQAVSPVYSSNAQLPENAETTWNQAFLNVAIRCESTFDPYELLHAIKNIEAKLGRTENARWSPRIIDIDILVWDSLCMHEDELTIPHTHLLQRPFALWPLADVAPQWQYPVTGVKQFQTAAQLTEKWGSRFSGEAPFHTQQINQRIDTPALMGIVNVTEHSFSDGGLFLHTEDAIKQIKNLVAAGAEIIDLGAESTAPNAPPIDEKLEWSRLEPIFTAYHSFKKELVIHPKLSLDTYHVTTAEQAILYGVDWINDVSGLNDLAMQQLLIESKKEVVLMHQLGIPASNKPILQPQQDAVAIVYEWGQKHIHELTKMGIAADKIIFDPGIGYGKSSAQSLALIRDAKQFKQLGTRVLIGHSRKRFLTLFTPREAKDRDIETVVLSNYLATQDIDYLRVHDVWSHAQALKVQAALE